MCNQRVQTSGTLPSSVSDRSRQILFPDPIPYSSIEWRQQICCGPSCGAVWTTSVFGAANILREPEGVMLVTGRSACSSCCTPVALCCLLLYLLAYPTVTLGLAPRPALRTTRLPAPHPLHATPRQRNILQTLPENGGLIQKGYRRRPARARRAAAHGVQNAGTCVSAHPVARTWDQRSALSFRTSFPIAHPQPSP